jgi:tetratricopeptide (TPR) repeat protein
VNAISASICTFSGNDVRVKLFVCKRNRFGGVGRKLLRRAGFLFLLGQSAAYAQEQAALAEQSHRAKELMAAGRYQDALPVYRQLVKALPGNSGLRLNLGLAEEFAGHPDRAIAQFELVLKAQPDNVPALTSLATARLQTQQPAAAIAPLRRLLLLQPANRNASGMLAGALLATDHPAEAAEQYRKLAASDDTDAKAWYGLGSSYEAWANRSFDQLTKLAIESPYSAALVAESSLQRGQFRSAFFFYRQAVASMPNLRGVHAGLAQVYRNTGHADCAAVEDHREAELAAQPCAANTVECQFAGGRLLDAAQATAMQPESLFWKTKALNALALAAFSRLGGLPESPELHAIKANILKGQKQYKEAAEEWRAALRLAPGDEGLHRELLTTLFLARDYEAVLPMLRDALQTEPKSADLNFMLGDALLQTQQPDKALPFLQAAVQANPGMLLAHASLGSALSQTDKTAEAIPHLERSLDTDEDGSLHYQLARAYQAAGNAARSRELMAQYQSITAKSQSAKEEVAKEAEIVAPAK